MAIVITIYLLLIQKHDCMIYLVACVCVCGGGGGYVFKVQLWHTSLHWIKANTQAHTCIFLNWHYHRILEGKHRKSYVLINSQYLPRISRVLRFREITLKSI